MGAAAITTLSGSTLLPQAPALPFLASLSPFLTGASIVSWAVATFWIPLLVVMNVWRYTHRRHLLRHNVQHWSMIFPLGMYIVRTEQLVRATGLSFLLIIPLGFVYIALAARLVTTLGLARSLRSLWYRGAQRP